MAVLTAARMTQPVVDQVLQRQHHGSLIGTDERKIFGHLDIDANAVLTQPQLEALQRFLNELRGSHGFESIGFRHVRDAGIREQVIDLSAEIGGFLNQQVRVRAIALGRHL